MIDDLNMAYKLRPVKHRKKLDDNIIINDATFIDYLQRFKKIALSMFEWQNLPSGMDARFLERCLYYDGRASMLYSLKQGGYINLRASTSGNLNIYGLPTKINCYSYNMQSMRTVFYGENNANQRKEEGCVLVLNDWESVPTATTMELFALRLYDAQRSCDVNIRNQKFPLLIVTDENQRLTMVNMYKEIDGNKPVIFGDDKLNDISKIKALKTDVPFIADKIQDYKKQIWNEALTYLGINNLADEKKERLISDETSSNNEVINMNLQSYLAPRQEAAKLFNEKYGENVSVRVRSDLYNIIKQQESIVNDYDFNDEAVTDIGEGE
jgi:hypothetical protein